MLAAGVGAYGKMPGAGDFFRLNAPAGFVAVWDPWLQAGMVQVAQAMGAGWEAAYMSAPIWRFSIAAGLAGPQAVTGVLMPSVDRVGRQFPLTLMAPLQAGTDLAAHHAAAEPLFLALEDLALTALQDDLTRDALEVALAALPDMALPDLSGGAGEGGSLWSSVLDGDVHQMRCAGLPAGAQMRGLFDLATTEAGWA
jgi:type VI secretion system protein ImpM